MANQVYANGREVSCKAAAGKAIAAFPDVCFTPPTAPPTPPGVPIPYPNNGMASDTAGGSRTVKISGKEVMLKNKSYFKKSTGDEAGSAPKKGVVTSQNRGKVYFTAWSMDVKFEGENVVRHLDLTTHNHASAPGNTPPWPYLDEMAIGVDGPCKDVAQKARDACSEHSKIKSRPKAIEAMCADDDCKAARACVLSPYSPSNCCDGKTGHHVVPVHCFMPPGRERMASPVPDMRDAKSTTCRRLPASASPVTTSPPESTNSPTIRSTRPRTGTWSMEKLALGPISRLPRPVRRA